MKDSKMNTKVLDVLGECESIIAHVENVVEFAIDDEITTKLLDSEDFETIRYTAEEMQSLVLGSDSDEYVVTTDEYAEEQSISLYQDVKYIVEALEDSITNEEILQQFAYIRESVNYIRGFFFNVME